MSFAFISGHSALDLAGTLKWRRDEPDELLAGPADVQRWLHESGELPGGATVGDDDYASAIELREAIYRLATDRIHGVAFDRRSLDAVNRMAGLPGLSVALTDAGPVRHGDARSALADLARSAIGVLADTDIPIKECGRPGCTRIYLDRSRGTRRAWCGMDECGNRVKAAAYRARKRAEVVGGRGPRRG